MANFKRSFGKRLHIIFTVILLLISYSTILSAQKSPRVLVPKEKSKSDQESKPKSLDIDVELQKERTPDRGRAYYHFVIAHLYEASDDVERAISEYREALKYDWDNSNLRSELAQTLFRAGSFTEAIAECRKAIALDNNNADAHYMLGFFTLRLAGSTSKKQLKDAIKEFEEVIRIDPTDPRAYNSLGRIYLSEKDYETAAKYLEKYNDLTGDPEGYALLAAAYEALGKKTEAIESLKKLLAVNPTSERALSMLLDLYARSNDVDNLINLLRKVVAGDKSNSVRRKQLATALLSARRYDEAIAELQSQIEADPNDALAYVHLGRAYAALRQPEKATEAFEKARTLDSDDKQVLYYLALAYEENGQSEKALRQLQELFDSTTKVSGIYTPEEREERFNYLRQMGIIHLRLGEPDKAIVALNRLKDLSDNPRDYELLVSAYRNSKEYDKALALSDEAIKKFSDDKYLKYQKGLILAQQGQVSQAAALVNPLIERDPKDLESYTALSEIYVQAKEFDKAEGLLLKATALDSNNENLRFRLGTVYERAKNYDKAEALFLQVLEKNPKSAETLNYLGYMLADRGVKLDKALDYVKKAVELDPNNGAYLDSLGWAYFKLNQLHLAEENLQRAVARLKNDPTIHDHLGDLYFKTGNLIKAEEAWQKAITNGSETEEIEKIKGKIQKLKKGSQNNH